MRCELWEFIVSHTRIFTNDDVGAVAIHFNLDKMSAEIDIFFKTFVKNTSGSVTSLYANAKAIIILS